MKKIKLFNYINVNISGNLSKLETEVNEFLAQDGKTIKVVDMRHQGHQSFVTVMVIYEDI